MATAIGRFHDRFPDTALQLNVTRYPYSFLGDSKGGGHLRSGGEATWHDGLIDYTGGTEAGALRAEAGLQQLGGAANIKFRFDVKTDWQPIDSQRLLLWAGRYGLQEEFMSTLNRYHFEERQSASVRSTLLSAATEVGLDVQAAEAFLDSDELDDEVWRSYGATIREAGIHAIPLFAFSVPQLDALGGPFRDAGEFEAYLVRGSSGEDNFLQLFELIHRDVTAGTRVYDEAPFSFRKDEWWAGSRAASRGQ